MYSMFPILKTEIRKKVVASKGMDLEICCFQQQFYGSCFHEWIFLSKTLPVATLGSYSKAVYWNCTEET